MKKLILLLIPILLFAACKRRDQNADFDAYKSAFLEELWKTYPVWASSQGYHAYDSLLPAPDAANRKREMTFLTNQRARLAQFNPTSLTVANRVDHALMRNFVEGSIWAINTERAYEWNPAVYNVCGVIGEMLTAKQGDATTRFRHINDRLRQVPAYYEAALANIKDPTLEHNQLAIDQNEGGLSVLTDELPAEMKREQISPELIAEIEKNSASAVAAIQRYVGRLKKSDHKSPRSFRLGKELYEQKFGFEIQSANSVEALYQKALQRKQFLHGKMFHLARKLWSKYCGTAPQPADSLVLIKTVIDKVSLQHVAPDSFQTAIEKQIPELTAFVGAKDLLYLDPAKPLVVRKEPGYMAGVAGASISAPGPYDKNGNTYYNVGSFQGWPAERVESYLREYNRYVLQILNIHEAIPGHYAQLVYSNQSPSLIKSILGNGSMVEGWAVYTELMMLENGYGNNSDEMWLMYYKWNLRTVCNTLLDIGVHTREMSPEQALHLLVNEAFQQQAEAEGKWKRVSVTSVQLTSYFNGFSEIVELRERLKANPAKPFSLKAFHEQFLSYGSAPVKLIATLMN